jgi:GWxTD domain-containing protein
MLSSGAETPKRSAVFRLSRPLAVVALAVTLSPRPVRSADDPLQTTLFDVKAAYRAKRWDDAERALRRLLELATAPEREAVRPRILPAYHFYAAAVAYERHDEERARTELSRFFDFQPDAALDPESYPKSFRVFFDARKNEKAKQAASNAPAAGPQSIAGGVLPAYSTSDFDESAIPQNTGLPEWVDGPVRFLLTDAERKRWATLPDDEARRDFVTAFWRRFDPDPLTPVNEFEVEFYRRVQYADAALSTESMRGSLSDRGQVLLILGPPTYVGQTPLRPSEDVMEVMRSTKAVVVPGYRGGGGIQYIQTNNSPLGTDVDGEVETWYYRQDRIPKGIPFTELQFLFVTRKGYGTAVLQKEPRELAALQKAARLLQHEHPE